MRLAVVLPVLSGCVVVAAADVEQKWTKSSDSRRSESRTRVGGIHPRRRGQSFRAMGALHAQDECRDLGSYPSSITFPRCAFRHAILAVSPDLRSCVALLGARIGSKPRSSRLKTLLLQHCRGAPERLALVSAGFATNLDLRGLGSEPATFQSFGARARGDAESGGSPFAWHPRCDSPIDRLLCRVQYFARGSARAARRSLRRMTTRGGGPAGRWPCLITPSAAPVRRSSRCVGAPLVNQLPFTISG